MNRKLDTIANRRLAFCCDGKIFGHYLVIHHWKVPLCPHDFPIRSPTRNRRTTCFGGPQGEIMDGSGLPQTSWCHFHGRPRVASKIVLQASGDCKICTVPSNGDFKGCPWISSRRTSNSRTRKAWNIMKTCNMVLICFDVILFGYSNGQALLDGLVWPLHSCGGGFRGPWTTQSPPVSGSTWPARAEAHLWGAAVNGTSQNSALENHFLHEHLTPKWLIAQFGESCFAYCRSAKLLEFHKKFMTFQTVWDA